MYESSSRRGGSLSALPAGDGDSPFNILARYILIAVVLVTPWLFGGVESRVQFWLVVGVVLAFACWLAPRLSSGSTAGALPLAMIPLLLAIGLGCLQLVPLGEGAQTLLSPKATELRRELLPPRHPSGTPLAETVQAPATPERFPISLDPASTRRDLLLLVSAVAVFLLGSLLFKSPAAQMLLCLLVVVNGSALALFGIVQKLTWNGQLYWSVPLRDGIPFGPFVNRNNAGGFLNLCLACAVAMTVWAFHSRRRSRSVQRPEEILHRGRFLQRPWRHLLPFVAGLNGPRILGMAAAGCIAAGILASLSRGAGLAMLAAVVLVSTLMAWRGRQKAWWLFGAVVLAGGLSLVGWAGMSGAMQGRFATLLDRNVLSQTRIPNWCDGAKAVPDFWRAGSGLGTYRHVYRLYQTRFDELWYCHAENEYLEWLVEGGIVALALVLTMIFLVAWAAWQILHDDNDARSVAFAVGGAFALTAQAVQAFFDFGLHIPANVALFALICGAMTGRAAQLARRGLTTRYLALSPACSQTSLLAVVLLIGCIVGASQLRKAANVEVALRNARLTKAPSKVTRSELLQKIRHLQHAADAWGSDLEAEYRLAGLWIHAYRIGAFEERRKQTPSGVSDAVLWQSTSQIGLHGRAHHLARHNRTGQLERLRNDALVRENLREALRRLVLARQASPLLPDVHAGIAELCFLVADPSADRIHVERARRLASGNTDMLFRCGLLDFQAGRFEKAWGSWRESLDLCPRYLGDVVRMAGKRLDAEQLVETVLPESPALLLEVARKHYQGKENDEVRAMIARRVQALLDDRGLAEDEESYLRSQALILEEDYSRAVSLLSRAVELRSEHADWRYQLAVLLKHQDRAEEAHDQARMCVHLQPASREYRGLLREINRTILLNGHSPVPIAGERQFGEPHLCRP